MTENNSVKVTNVSFTNLFKQSMIPPDRRFPIALDTYQRDFVWNDEKIKQLGLDLKIYQAEKVLQPGDPPQPDYYMGTILIHTDEGKEDPKHFIIDGQQRLTALCVLHHQLHQRLPENCALTYSAKSARVIRRAADIYRETDLGIDKDIFDRVQFTMIQVDDVDLAFTFFDTQNNRGVNLHAADLLKAYHLREVKGEPAQKEAIQKLCGQRWESVQHGRAVMSHDLEFAPSLFTKFLWRSRNWTGRQVHYGDHDALMKEFQEGTWKLEGQGNTIPLYRSRQNRMGTALTIEREGYSEIHTNRISLSSHAADLPFAIRQPVHKGIGFFLYVEKYASLLRWLMQEETGSSELRGFRRLFDQVLMANSFFLREIFLLCSLMFVDQFGDEKLLEFARWLEHALGGIRLDLQQVRYEAAQNFFKNDQRNLLDVISNSYLPEQVIIRLRLHHAEHFENIYKAEKLISGQGVQGRYKQAVLGYYNRDPGESLANKRSWLSEFNRESRP